MESYHIFFDSLEQWQKHAHTDIPVYCISIKEDYPSHDQEGVRLIYGIIQLSQIQEKGVHHIRFLVTKHPSSDEAQRTIKTKLLDETYQNIINWLKETGFRVIRQGLVSYHKDLRTLQTPLPEELSPKVATI